MASFDVSAETRDLLRDTNARITVLTGAGISAESGIPTFRGPEGFWTEGSTVYTPQEIATQEMFAREPETVWRWYLQRMVASRDAEPNAGHGATVKMEQQLGDRFALITQNIDNLHLRAGNSEARTFQIHGNITRTRCARPCGNDLIPFPGTLLDQDPGDDPGNSIRNLLQCPDCGGWLRPHVLWFDEYYNEEWFRAETALRVAGETDVLIIAGTSGATTLPNYIVSLVMENDRPIIDINLEPSPFSRIAESTPGGMFIQASCSDALSAIAGLVRSEE